jgi:TetR/AcrR family transcriptional repressor of lmrAB and yxaGH operons
VKTPYLGVGMRPMKVADKEVMARLMRAFRAKGYEGASYADLMAATGLVKASLYHRFPGGKEEIVDAILSQVDREFSEYVLRPAWEEGLPQERARRMARRLNEFYGSGRLWCLLDTVTLSSSACTVKHAGHSMEFWIESLARVARDAGLPAVSARRRAEDAVAAIEGALVVSRVTKNRRPFARALASLPRRLTNKGLREVIATR